MKRITAALLCLIMVLGMFGCAPKESANTETPAVTAPAEDVAMQYISVEEAAGLLEDDAYIFFDVRKAADYEIAHIPGAEGHDMDAAKEGDFAAGVATMETAIKNLDKNIILVCYSGKRYAQAATNVLSALGYDMSKVYTLEGGFTAWSETYPSNVEVSAEIVAPAEDVAMQYITPAEALEVLESEEYVFFDVRKAADYETAHIPGALSYDMDAAKEGDFKAGVATMQVATRGLDKNIVVICYSGKRYAQATTNVLSALGYDMSKVYTLEGGFTAWSETYPDNIETPAEVATKDGVVTFTLDMTQYEQGKVVRAWLPIAQSNDYQTVNDVVFSATDAKAELTKDSLGNQMLYIEWGADVDAASRKATCSFHVSRQEIVRPELVENGTVGADMAKYLAATSTIPVDGVVKETADEIVKNETTYLGKARAIYDWVIETMHRDNSVIGCGTGDVCTLLDTKGGKCTDINSVFVGLCRAAGIPAREMFGVRINAEDITKNQHCWAEFYLPGTGWVAADPADVLKAVLTNEWDKDSAETKEKQEFYWGSSEAERLELSAGRDIVLSPAQAGEPLNNFGYPYAEVDGVAQDYYAPDQFVYTISFAEDK